MYIFEFTAGDEATLSADGTTGHGDGLVECTEGKEFMPRVILFRAQGKGDTVAGEGTGGTILDLVGRR